MSESKEEEPKYLVYWASYTLETAKSIRSEILDATGLFCHIGQITEDVREKLHTVEETKPKICPEV